MSKRREPMPPHQANPEYTIGIRCHVQEGFGYQEKLRASQVSFPEYTDFTINLYSPKYAVPRVPAQAMVPDVDGQGNVNLNLIDKAILDTGIDLADKRFSFKDLRTVRFVITGGEFGACLRNTVESLMSQWHHMIAGSLSYYKAVRRWRLLPEIVVPFDKVWDMSKSASNSEVLSSRKVVYGGRFPSHLGYWTALPRLVVLRFSDYAIQVLPRSDILGDGHLHGIWYNDERVATVDQLKERGYTDSTLERKALSLRGRWLHKELMKRRKKRGCKSGA